MELTPSQVGARAEKAVAIALARAGYDVLLPAFGAHFRYDLVVDDGGRLLRVHCKTSRVRDEVVVFLTCSNTGNRPKDYRGEVDYFGVHSHELGEVYLVPVDDVPFRAAHLRLKRRATARPGAFAGRGTTASLPKLAPERRHADTDRLRNQLVAPRDRHRR